MLLKAILSDPGPHGRRARELLDLVRRFFSVAEHWGRIWSLPVLARNIRQPLYELKELLLPISQAWLEINDDAEPGAKAHYKALMDRHLGKLDPGVRAVVQSAMDAVPRQAFVSDMQARTFLTKVTAPMSEEFVKVHETRMSPTTTKATDFEAMIARIRYLYVLAALGETPTIPNIMRSLALMGEDGQPTAKAAALGISEAEVRRHQLAGDWRRMREDHVSQAFDIVPAEVKLIAIARAVEMHRILFDHAKTLSHLFTQYYKTGEMLALDGGGKKLALAPNPVIIASLAETMRRMVDGSGEKLTITLATTMASQRAQGEDAKAEVQLTLASKEYLAKLQLMSESEILGEIDSMDKLRLLMATGGEAQAASMDASPEHASIDAEVSKP